MAITSSVPSTPIPSSSPLSLSPPPPPSAVRYPALSSSSITFLLPDVQFRPLPLPSTPNRLPRHNPCQRNLEGLTTTSSPVSSPRWGSRPWPPTELRPGCCQRSPSRLASAMPGLSIPSTCVPRPPTARRTRADLLVGRGIDVRTDYRGEGEGEMANPSGLWPGSNFHVAIPSGPRNEFTVVFVANEPAGAALRLSASTFTSLHLPLQALGQFCAARTTLPTALPPLKLPRTTPPMGLVLSSTMIRSARALQPVSPSASVSRGACGLDLPSFKSISPCSSTTVLSPLPLETFERQPTSSPSPSLLNLISFRLCESGIVVLTRAPANQRF